MYLVVPDTVMIARMIMILLYGAGGEFSGMKNPVIQVIKTYALPT